MTAERVVLHGRVQGVGFRYTVLGVARRHAGVAGTVRNVGGDLVEIHAEGDPAQVDAFIADVLAHPPAAARVTATRREAAQPRGLTGFTALASAASASSASGEESGSS